MGLILCSSNTVEHPYYIEELGIHIYSIEELCYIICEYPMLTMDGFVNDRLKTFITDELGLGIFVSQYEKNKGYSLSDQEFILSILEYSDYLSQIELTRFKTKVAVINKMSDSEYLKAKGDFLYGLAKYGKAARYYEKALKTAQEDGDPKIFIGKIYNNLGSSYANLFLLEEAYKAFDMAYDLIKSNDILKQIYFLSLSAPTIELRERYQSMVREDMRVEWEKQYESIMHQARNNPRVEELKEIFSRDSVKRTRIIHQTITGWKREYRNML